MRLGRPTPPLTLTDDERETLGRWARRPKTAQALAQRARMVLECAKGKTNTGVAAELRVSEATVGKWRSRFLERRLDGLLDEPRPGRPRTVTDADVERVVTLTLETTPKDATHWSTRSMARHVGLSPNPPKDTDGRREDSGRGWVKELQGRWPGVGVDGRPADGLQSPHRAPKALCGSCDARDGERIRSRGLSRPGWREIAGTLSQLQASRQAGNGMACSRAKARLNWVSQGQRRGRCKVRRRAERVIRPTRAKTRRLRVLVITVRSPRPIRAVQRARLCAITWTASQAPLACGSARRRT